MRRQRQRGAHRFGVFQHIADIAAADAQAFGRRHGVLRGDAGVGHSQQQVAGAGVARGGARGAVGARPAAAVGQKDQAQRRGGDHRLVVAQVGQLRAQRRVGDVQNRVQLLAACRRRVERGVQNGRALLRRDRLVREHAHRPPRGELVQHFVTDGHGETSLFSVQSPLFGARSPFPRHSRGKMILPGFIVLQFGGGVKACKGANQNGKAPRRGEKSLAAPPQRQNSMI